MSENNTAASQMHNFMSTETVTKMFEQIGNAQSKWVEYGTNQIDEMSALMKAQFNYANELAASFRKLTK